MLWIGSCENPLARKAGMQAVERLRHAVEVQAVELPSVTGWKENRDCHKGMP